MVGDVRGKIGIEPVLALHTVLSRHRRRSSGTTWRRPADRGGVTLSSSLTARSTRPVSNRLRPRTTCQKRTPNSSRSPRPSPSCSVRANHAPASASLRRAGRLALQDERIQVRRFLVAFDRGRAGQHRAAATLAKRSWWPLRICGPCPPRNRPGRHWAEGHLILEQGEIAQPGGQSEDVHLPAGIIDVVFAVHREAGKSSTSDDAVGCATPMADVQRPVGRRRTRPVPEAPA